MKNAIARGCCGLAIALATSACSAPLGCDRYSTRSDPLEAGPLTRQARMEALGDSSALQLTATLSGLPELWPEESAILDGNLTVQVRLSYEGEPQGADGRTEMPQIAVTIGDGRAAVEPTLTSSFPFANGQEFASPLFRACSSPEEQSCCPFGARECSLPLEVTLERMDGAPFPAVIADYEVRATTTVSTCPIGEDTPALTLAVVQ